ncbi:hypothetical protein J7E83_05725 [Arthrobacter sp. ISL-48]|uniref:hypothetical protein n=1 Tax=Arthrobacter sp. ISL-48 TaxID=2819110 RepID=UPI001BE6D391|nr:hypothetical protein [Arthrobacter sp. ISL-48]MBT2531627.1 hypothetical protein [Arthrobacter sp. ISL-48]
MERQPHHKPRTRTEWRNAYRDIVRSKMRHARAFVETCPENTPKGIRQPMQLSEWLAASPEERDQVAYENMRAEALAIVGEPPAPLPAGKNVLTMSELQRRILRVPDSQRGELFDQLTKQYAIIEDAGVPA